MKKFIEEFKKFALRGNVIDLAVGVIIGGAFTGIVNGLSNNILKPLINWILAMFLDSEGLAGAITPLSMAYNADGTYDLANSIYIDWGAFISTIINFLIIAFALFTIVRIMNHINEGIADVKKEAKEMTTKEVIELRKQGKKRKEIKKIMADRKAKIAAEAEAKKKREEEEKKKNAPPTTEELLTAILEEIKKDNK